MILFVALGRTDDAITIVARRLCFDDSFVKNLLPARRSETRPDRPNFAWEASLG